MAADTVLQKAGIMVTPEEELTATQRAAAAMETPKEEVTDRTDVRHTAIPTERAVMAAEKEGAMAVPKAETMETRKKEGPTAVLKAEPTSSLQEDLTEEAPRAGISVLQEEELSVTEKDVLQRHRKAEEDSPARTGNLQEGISDHPEEELSADLNRQAKVASQARGTLPANRHARLPRNLIRTDSMRTMSRTSI